MRPPSPGSPVSPAVRMVMNASPLFDRERKGADEGGTRRERDRVAGCRVVDRLLQVAAGGTAIVAALPAAADIRPRETHSAGAKVFIAG